MATKTDKKKLTIDQRLDRIEETTVLILEKLDHALDRPAPEEKKGKEWKEGDWVVYPEDHNGERLWNSSNMPKWIGVPMKVLEVDERDALCRPCPSETWYFDLKWLRPATPEEVLAYSVEQEKGVLGQYDACICTVQERAELLAMAREGGIPLRTESQADYLQERMIGVWWLDGRLTPLSSTDKDGVDPFPLFRKKLQNTIQAKKIQEEQRVTVSERDIVKHYANDKVVRVVHVKGTQMLVEHVDGKEEWWNVGNCEPPSPVEVRRFLEMREIKQREKLEAEEKERSRPVNFGDRVMHKCEEWRAACDGPNAKGYYCLVRRNDRAFDEMASALRRDFTILKD